MAHNLKYTHLNDQWQNYAACKGLAFEQGSFDTFFPERWTRQPKAARALCASCPVQVRCLDFALHNRVGEGIWGGKSEQQRRAIRRSHRYSEVSLVDELEPALIDVCSNLANE